MENQNNDFENFKQEFQRWNLNYDDFEVNFRIWEYFSSIKNYDHNFFYYHVLKIITNILVSKFEFLEYIKNPTIRNTISEIDSETIERNSDIKEKVKIHIYSLYKFYIETQTLNLHKDPNKLKEILVNTNDEINKMNSLIINTLHPEILITIKNKVSKDKKEKPELTSSIYM